MAYRAGHAVAMNLAASIRGQGLGPQEQEARLREAYAMNAFADHFLIDLLSADHPRAPRKAMYEQVTTPVPGLSGNLGSLLVRCMHDPDSPHGLNVRNAASDAWVAYGVKSLLDHVSADNRSVVVPCDARVLGPGRRRRGSGASPTYARRASRRCHGRFRESGGA